MSRKIKLEVEFEIGTIKELGLGGFHMEWMSAKLDDMSFDLTCGAGLGNSLIMASATKGEQHIYAQGSIKPLTNELFEELRKELEPPLPGELVEGEAT